jgi:hypothetical protein
VGDGEVAGGGIYSARELDPNSHSPSPLESIGLQAQSSSNGAVTGPWPSSFSGRIFLNDPTGPRPGPGGSRSGRTLGLDRDCLPLFQSPGIASRPRRYPDMATVAHDFHAITSSLASF